MRRAQILYFDGCPNHESAQRLVERIAREVGVPVEVDFVEVPSAEEAERLRFLGSPSVRIDGRDVEPGAENRRDYTLSCRIYRTRTGVAGEPDEEWVRAALRKET